MPIKRQLQIDICEYLEGTCKSAEDAARAFNVELEDVEQAVEDGEFQLCETCGWWNETCEMDANGNCSDCSEVVEDD